MTLAAPLNRAERYRVQKLSPSRPHFFNVGNTRACPHSTADRPDSNEMLIIQVITGNSTSRTCRTTDVGAGSKGQDFMAAFPVIKETWSCVKFLKFRDSTDSRGSGSTQFAHAPRYLRTHRHRRQEAQMTEGRPVSH